ncbi:MAG TPA: tetratricopeptide repeat protein [Nannocystaceae bacterium]|nr:tetratricopeptide repeat protein [Nannocystaceae bacterium]
MRAAVLLAIAAAHDAVAIDAATRLGYVVGYRQAHYAEGRSWCAVARALIDRSGARDERPVRVEITESSIALGEGKPGDALPPLDAAVARLEHLPLSTELAAVLNNRAAAHSLLGQRDRVAADFERALAVYREVLGPEHPDIALLLSNVGNIRLLQGDLDGAEAAQKEALALKERLVSPDHPDVATVLTNLGSVYQRRGDADRALALFQRALAIRERALSPDHPSTANALGNVGEILNEMGQPAEGRDFLLRALAIREKAEGAEHPMVAALLSRVGRAEIDLGRPKDGRIRLERALTIYARNKGTPEELRYTDFHLARARCATARNAKDRAAARALAEAALASVDRTENAKDAHEIEAWLASTRD